jgi:hypothetical protein
MKQDPNRIIEYCVYSCAPLIADLVPAVYRGQKIWKIKEINGS